MKKSLTPNGNTWQLYINKPIAQLIGINKNDFSVSLVIKNKVLYIQKASNSSSTESVFIKKLIKRSAGYGLNLPIPILELLDINPETDIVEISIDEDKLIIQKAVD